MDVGIYSYSHGDPLLIDKIVNEFLSQGKFDKLRKECMSDADTKPAYQNLQQRVENTVTQFLKKQVWRPDLNKNQLRDSLRKHILESGFFDAGINRIVDQVVNPNVLATVFLPEVEEVVYNYLSIPRPTDKNQKKCPADEKIKPPGSENDSQASQENGKCEKRGNNDHRGNELEEDNKPRDFLEKNVSRVRDVRTPPAPVKTEPPGEEKGKRAEVQIKAESKIKSEPEEVNSEETQTGTPRRVEKMEVPSEESQDSLGRMGVDGLQLNEPEEVPAPDSDDSVPLEINEKSMSESRDSEDSIMNQMSPISQGRLTPDILEEEKGPKVEETSEEKKEVKEVKEEERKPLTFIGRIPKLKREDSESSKPKDEKSPKEKLDVKNVYSSDESDSSKSYGKSDSDERKSKGKSEKPQTEERKPREEAERRRKHEDRRRSSKDRKRDERSKEGHSRDRKRERSRERHAVKKSSSSSSSSNARERSSSHRRSSYGRHRDSKDKSKRKEEEEEKKKSKSADDHGKERNKKEDRRSTDRDSNERERDRSSGSRVQGESKRREREEKTSEGKESREKDEAQAEDEGEHVPDSEEWPGQPQEEEECIDLGKLFLSGAIARLDFPKIADDFYVKFNSTGFKYFEDWEQSKLDCEEEFKEFVDEAESNLALISDDETDSENEFNFREENRRTVRNLLAGFGNFRRSLMFDPSTSDFYKWTSAKSYQKFRKKGEKREKRSRERNESDESIKENIDKNKENREKENQALHLKLLSRYRRKALRLGKHRRRHRRPPESRGIKEKNENRSATEKHFLFRAKVRGAAETESFLGSVPIKTILECGLVETGSMEGGGEGTVDALTSLLREDSRATVTLPESPDENEEWGDAQKAAGLPPKCSLPLNLPLSPDSDDLGSNGVAPKDATINRKRPHKADTDGRRAKRPTRRNWSQKYDSQDLYKPRPILNSSRSRGRERGLEPEIVNLESTVSRCGSLNGK